MVNGLRQWRLRGSVGAEARQCPLNSASLAWMMQRRTGQQRWDVAVEGAQASRARIIPTSVWESEEDARKATGAWSEALRRLKTTSTAGEGGPVSQRPPQDGLQSLSDGTVNIPTGLADVGGRTGENDIGKLGEGGYSLQMRVAHLVQQHQRLLELGNPALEHLFTEGGRANRAAKEREPLTGDRDLRWQWGERRNAALAGQRGGTCLR